MIDSTIRAMLEGKVELPVDHGDMYLCSSNVCWLIIWHLMYDWQHNRAMLEGKVELTVDHGDMYLCSSNVAETTGLFNYLTVFYQYLSKRYN